MNLITRFGKVLSIGNKILFTLLIITSIVSYSLLLDNHNLLAVAQSEDKNPILATGPINSTIKDTGGATWLLSGTWKGNLFTNADFNNTNQAKFSATINMVMGNGSSAHKHKISDFELANVSKHGNGTTVYEGIMSISMEKGPIFGIPYVIKNLQNRILSISLQGITSDQKEVIDHFGNRPIIGTFLK
jgi:hypothetical protein